MSARSWLFRYLSAGSCYYNNVGPVLEVRLLAKTDAAPLKARRLVLELSYADIRALREEFDHWERRWREDERIASVTV